MKTLFVILLFTFTTLTAFCEEDTIIFYSKIGKVVGFRSNPESYDQVKKMTESVWYLEHYIWKANNWVHDGDDNKMITINDSTYQIYGKITSKTDTIYRVVQKYKSGYIIKDYQDKILVSTGFSKLIIPLVKEGKWTNYYFSTGRIKSEEEYVKNQMTSNIRWTESLVEDLNNVFPRAEVDPEFKGGPKKLIAYFFKNTRYPGKSDRQGEKGTVTVQFVVMEDGAINCVEVISGVSPALDAEAIRVVKSMPPWTPGKIDGKNVRVMLQIPFQFSFPVEKKP
jgi:TonB family protein